MSTEIHLLSDEAKKLAQDTAAQAKAEAQRVGAEVNGVVADLKDRAEEGCDRVAGKAQQALAAAQRTAHNAAAAAKDVYHSAREKVDCQLTSSREFVQRNPVPVVLGALALGVALGYLLMPGRRAPSLAHRYLDEPLDHARVALLAALAPVASRLHEGYDMAKDGAERVIDRVQDLEPRSILSCLAQRVVRFGTSLIAR